MAMQCKSSVQARPCARPSLARKAVVCKAQSSSSSTAQKLATAGAAALLALSGPLSGAAVANEFDILGAPAPSNTHYLDDAEVLSKATRGELNSRLTKLQIDTGYRLDMVTVRKLEFETDAFAFSDKVFSEWNPSGADKKGIVLVVTSGKEGAISGGADFVTAVGDDLIDSIVGENIPVLTEQEKYNQAITSVVDRIEAKLNNREVPPAPQRNEVNRQRTYKTKEETEKSKNVTSTVVVSLLVIAVVVPMLQYYGYTARD